MITGSRELKEQKMNNYSFPLKCTLCEKTSSILYNKPDEGEGSKVLLKCENCEFALIEILITNFPGARGIRIFNLIESKYILGGKNSHPDEEGGTWEEFDQWVEGMITGKGVF